jgi:thiamine biosynthesis lipoprotein
VQNELASVTVLSESSALGDALSTAFLALGTEKAMQLAARIEGVEIICVTRSGEVVMSEGASSRLTE